MAERSRSLSFKSYCFLFPFLFKSLLARLFFSLSLDLFPLMALIFFGFPHASSFFDCSAIWFGKSWLLVLVLVLVAEEMGKW